MIRLGIVMITVPCVPPKTNMTLQKKQPFEDVSPIKNGGFSIAMLVYWRGDYGVPTTKKIVQLFSKCVRLNSYTWCHNYYVPTR